MSISYHGVAVVAAMASLLLWRMVLEAPNDRRTALWLGLYGGAIVCIKFTFGVFAVPIYAVFAVRNLRGPRRIAELAATAAATVASVFLIYYRSISGIANHIRLERLLVESQASWYAVKQPFLQWLAGNAITAIPGWIVPICAATLILSFAIDLRRHRVLLTLCMAGSFVLVLRLFAARAYSGMFPESGAALVVQAIVLTRYSLSDFTGWNRVVNRGLIAAGWLAALAAFIAIASVSEGMFSSDYTGFLKNYSDYDKVVRAYALSGGKTLTIELDDSYKVPGNSRSILQIIHGNILSCLP